MSRGKKILDMLKLPSPNYNDTDSGLGARQNQLDFIENFEVEDMIFDNDNITSGQLSDDIINLENPLVNKGVQKATPTNTINAFPPAFLSDDTNDNNDSCPQIIIHNILTLKNSVVNTEVPDTNFTDVSDVSPQQPLNVISNNTVKGESLNYDSQSIFPCINNLLESVHATPCPDDIMELCQEEKEGIKIWQIEHEVRETVSQNTDLEESQVAMIKSAQLVQPLPETLKLGRDETVDQDVSKDQDVEANTEKNENRSRTYTKNGNLRKRKKCGESRSVKKQKMDRKLRDSHPILPPCPAICKKRCFIKIDEKQRQQLNKDYWNLSWTERHMFVKGSIEQTIVKRRTIDVPAEDSKLRRNHSNYFLLKDKKGSLNSVCRTFFLTTLGYKKNNNTIIKTSISYKNNSSNSLTVRDNRGTHSNRRNVDRAVLERHVNLFLELTDFKDWLDHTSLQKIKKHSQRPYLSEIVKLKFQRGSYNMWYSYEYDAAYTELNFLTAKYLKQPVLPKSRERCRGITKSKKDDILKKLCPLMPQNRRHFWELLPISDEVVDLIKETDC